MTTATTKPPRGFAEILAEIASTLGRIEHRLDGKPSDAQTKETA